MSILVRSPADCWSFRPVHVDVTVLSQKALLCITQVLLELWFAFFCIRGTLWQSTGVQDISAHINRHAGRWRVGLHCATKWLTLVPGGNRIENPSNNRSPELRLDRVVHPWISWPLSLQRKTAICAEEDRNDLPLHPFVLHSLSHPKTEPRHFPQNRIRFLLNDRFTHPSWQNARLERQPDQDLTPDSLSL